MGEFERIARLRARFLEATARTHVDVDIGDDAAIVDLGAPAVLSTDASIEGVHFRRDFAPLDVLARRAVMAAASDLAAMGANGAAMLLSLTLPSSLTDAEFDLLVAGFADASRELAMPIVGGNLARAGELGITTTVVGRDAGRRMLRGGARAGDDVYVTGPIGGAALGLCALLRGAGDPNDAFVRAWCAPRARFDAAERVRAIATSCIDVSDGLSADLGHVLEASGVGATIVLDSVPTLPGFLARCATELREPESVILEGGEDYELVFTASPGSVDSAVATRIGHVDEERGLRVESAGDVRAITPRGHDHG